MAEFNRNAAREEMKNHINDTDIHLSAESKAKLVLKDGATMEGPLVAQSNTNYTVRQVRNIIISTAEPTASDGQDGDIWIVYEA